MANKKLLLRALDQFVNEATCPIPTEICDKIELLRQHVQPLSNDELQSVTDHVFVSSAETHSYAMNELDRILIDTYSQMEAFFHEHERDNVEMNMAVNTIRGLIGVPERDNP